MNTNDPRFIIARFAGTCSCGKAIHQGDVILYLPISRAAVCAQCGGRKLGPMIAALGLGILNTSHDNRVYY